MCEEDTLGNTLKHSRASIDASLCSNIATGASFLHRDFSTSPQGRLLSLRKQRGKKCCANCTSTFTLFFETVLSEREMSHDLKTDWKCCSQVLRFDSVFLFLWRGRWLVRYVSWKIGSLIGWWVCCSIRWFNWWVDDPLVCLLVSFLTCLLVNVWVSSSMSQRLLKSDMWQIFRVSPCVFRNLLSDYPEFNDEPVY